MWSSGDERDRALVAIASHCAAVLAHSAGEDERHCRARGMTGNYHFAGVELARQLGHTPFEARLEANEPLVIRSGKAGPEGVEAPPTHPREPGRCLLHAE